LTISSADSTSSSGIGSGSVLSFISPRSAEVRVASPLTALANSS
jgi:hypothetical protein